MTIDQIQIGAVYYREVNVVKPSGVGQGTPVDADSLPTINLIVNGTDLTSDATDLTVGHLNTGKYSITFTVPSAWKIGANVSVFFNIILSAYTGSPFRNTIDNFSLIPGAIGGVNFPSQVDADALYAAWGETNIQTWADANNTNDPTQIATKINYAISVATAYVLGRLRRRYALPIGTLPTLVVDLIIKRSGIELWSMPKGLVEGDDQAKQIASINGIVEDRLAQILAGRLPLIDGSQTEPVNTIRAIREPCYLGMGEFEGWDDWNNLQQMGGNWLFLLPNAFWSQVD